MGEVEEEEEELGQGQGQGGSNAVVMSAVLATMQKFLDKSSTAFDAMGTMAKSTRKRGREDEDGEEEPEAKSQPKLIRVENHLLEDDAHTVLDWTVRNSVRPFNGGDQKLYWSKRVRKEVPVLEDLDIGHLTKSPINPLVIAKIHDRGCQTTAKQWLSSNYSVEEKGGKFKAYDEKSAGAFMLNYDDAKGAWDAVDAIHNYGMVLAQVRPDDWSGRLLIHVLHVCRMFSHPKFSDRVQKDIIMDFFDQVRNIRLLLGNLSILGA